MIRIRLHLLCLLLFGYSSYALAEAQGGDSPFTVVIEGDKKGLHDEHGNAVIPVRYDDLGWSQGKPEVHDKVIGYRENSRWGLIDIKNRKVCDALFAYLYPYVDELLVAAKYKNDGHALRYGVVNTDGEQEQAFRYLSLTPHQQHLIASVSKDQQALFGIVDSKGKAVVGFEYTAIKVVSPTHYALRNQQQKVALFSLEGEPLTKFSYDSIGQFQHNLAITYLRGKRGLIDQTGQERVPNEYQDLEVTNGGSVRVLPFRHWKALTSSNKIVQRYTFEDFQPVGVNLYRVRVGATETFVNGQGEVVVPERWRVARFYQKFAVLTDQGKYGVLRNDAPAGQQVVVPIAYDSVRVEGDHIIVGKKSIKAGDACYGWQLLDAHGKVLSPYTYQEVGVKQEQLFAVKRKNHWGYVDTTGQEVISCQYLEASPFSNGRASVNFVEGQGVIDTQGQWIVKPFKQNGAKLHLTPINNNLYIFQTETPRYEAPEFGLIDSQGTERYRTHHKLTDNGHSLWEQDDTGRYGLISYTGRQLLPTRFDTISDLQEGKVYVYGREGHYGILSWEGKVLQNPDNNFEELQPMSNSFLGVKINGKYGFVDEHGRLRIANRYDSITRFQHNMAAVKMMGHWGYINKSERLLVQPHFDGAQPFRGKVAVVSKGGKYGMVNTQGRTVVPLVYERITPTASGRYLIQINDPKRGRSVGLISEEGKPLIHPKYDSVEDLGNGYVIVSRKGKFGLLTVGGRTTVPMVHPQLTHDPFNEVYLTVTQPKWKSVDL